MELAARQKAAAAYSTRKSSAVRSMGSPPISGRANRKAAPTKTFLIH